MIATKESWLLLSSCECCCREGCSAFPALTIFMNLRIAKDYTTSQAMLQVINTALTVICWRFREELILSDATREAVESPPLEILKTCLLPPWATCTRRPCSGGGLDEMVSKGVSRGPFQPQPFCDSVKGPKTRTGQISGILILKFIWSQSREIWGDWKKTKIYIYSTSSTQLQSCSQAM